MGYTVQNVTFTKNYVLSNGAALLFVYIINFGSQFVATCCQNNNQKQKAKILQRILQTSRVLYWFGIATMFSCFPPFFYGLHNTLLGWFTLILVFLMHVFCFVRKFDKHRSSWAYFYYFYHLSVFIWIATSLTVGYYLSDQQNVPADSIQN